MFLLENPIQNYAWGSKTELAKLQQRAAATGPEAELWIGAHPKAPSRLAGGPSLSEALERHPEWLGPSAQQRFGRLPFLLKVLAVETPLSLQVHPNLDQARAGFLREETAGVPITARERNYKDDNHKPELLCALSRFEALCGFRPPAESAQLLGALPLSDSSWLESLAHPGGLAEAFSFLMKLEGPAKERALSEALEGCEHASSAPGPLQASYRWATKLGRQYPGDIGALASLLLNHIELAPMEAIYLPARRLHAYLQGTGVELMANSDNVLRGGLTPKHVDLPELMSVLLFEASPAKAVATAAEPNGVVRYQTPAAEFALGCVDLTPNQPLRAAANEPQLWLCTRGSATLQASQPVGLRLEQGCAAFVPANTGTYRIEGDAQLFRAGLPSCSEVP